MTIPAESDAACQAYLGVQFVPLQGGLDAEDVELVMRDARRFARGAAAYCGSEIEVPPLAELQVGSLTVIFELVSTMSGLAGFLKLVERYWNLSVRIALERDQIALERVQLRQAMENLDQEALEREVDQHDALSGADERRTKERLRAREGVLGRELGDVSRKLERERKREQRRRGGGLGR